MKFGKTTSLWLISRQFQTLLNEENHNFGLLFTNLVKNNVKKAIYLAKLLIQKKE